VAGTRGTATSPLFDLLARTALGDQGAFSQLYQLTSPKLFSVAMRILRHEERAEECLQEAFVNIWRQASSYNADKSAPMTWMTTVVRNRALDLLRQRRPETQADDAQLIENIEDSNDRTDAVEFGGESRRLAQCLGELKDEQRRCVLLAYYEGHTHPELATRLKVPVGTIKTWIRRGLQQLRQCLDQ
jgi:RNA polymerase sigma-70 factor (ECF subfamily)